MTITGETTRLFSDEKHRNPIIGCTNKKEMFVLSPKKAPSVKLAVCPSKKGRFFHGYVNLPECTYIHVWYIFTTIYSTYMKTIKIPTMKSWIGPWNHGSVYQSRLMDGGLPRSWPGLCLQVPFRHWLSRGRTKKTRRWYRWWTKSWHHLGWLKPGIIIILGGAGFCPSTVPWWIWVVVPILFKKCHPYLGEDEPILTSIFFIWVEPVNHHRRIRWCINHLHSGQIKATSTDHQSCNKVV